MGGVTLRAEDQMAAVGVLVGRGCSGSGAIAGSAAGGVSTATVRPRFGAWLSLALLLADRQGEGLGVRRLSTRSGLESPADAYPTVGVLSDKDGGCFVNIQELAAGMGLEKGGEGKGG